MRGHAPHEQHRPPWSAARPAGVPPIPTWTVAVDQRVAGTVCNFGSRRSAARGPRPLARRRSRSTADGSRTDATRPPGQQQPDLLRQRSLGAKGGSRHWLLADHARQGRFLADDPRRLQKNPVLRPPAGHSPRARQPDVDGDRSATTVGRPGLLDRTMNSAKARASVIAAASAAPCCGRGVHRA